LKRSISGSLQVRSNGDASMAAALPFRSPREREFAK